MPRWNGQQGLAPPRRLSGRCLDKGGWTDDPRHLLEKVPGGHDARLTRAIAAGGRPARRVLSLVR
jgi:hypothetical protein